METFPSTGSANRQQKRKCMGFIVHIVNIFILSILFLCMEDEKYQVFTVMKKADILSILILY